MAKTEGEKICPLSSTSTAQCDLLIITIMTITCYNCASNHCGNMCAVVVVTMVMRDYWGQSGVMENLHFDVIKV